MSSRLKYLPQFITKMSLVSKLVIIAVLILVVGSASAEIVHTKNVKSHQGTQPQSSVTSQNSTASSQTKWNWTPPTLPSTTTPPAANTQSNPTPTTNNSAQCNSVLAAGKSELSSLNTQIVQQLQIMKAIIGDSSIDNEILSYGGSLSQIIGQSQITESFNQANDKADSLINQISPTRENYVNQLESLQCWSQALAILNYNPASQ